MALTKNIALVGGRATGKSTISKLLAEKLGRELLETDQLIIQKAGKSIPQIVKESGWQNFREMEYQVVSGLKEKNGAIFDCGGGIVCEQDQNDNQQFSQRKIDALQENSLVIWLDCSTEEQLRRIGEDANRPALTCDKSAKKEMQEIMRLRRPWYRQAAHFIINTEDFTVETVVERIVSITVGLDLFRIVPEPEKQICTIIGDPVEHSMSPAMHNAAYDALGLPYSYQAVQIKPDDLQQAVNAIKTLGVRGVSVTFPHKIAVMEYLDEVDEIAQKIGAVNTIVNTKGHLKGYNTDWEGAMRSIEEGISIKGKTAVVIGAGGAARGIAFGLLQREVDRLIILNRTEEKAQSLAGEIGCESGGLDQLEKYLASADILFQTTSVGMHPHMDESIVPKKYLRPELFVTDAVYNPFETKLIKEAKEAGCKVAIGHRMLLWQGVAQFELYTGQKAPVAVMEKALIHHLTKQ